MKKEEIFLTTLGLAAYLVAWPFIIPWQMGYNHAVRKFRRMGY